MQRPVQVYDWVMAPTPEVRGPWIKRPTHQGVFLGFSADSEESDYGKVWTYPVALIERIEGEKNGCVETAPHDCIRFLDTAEKVKSKPKNGDVPYKEIIAAYHDILPMLSRVRVLTPHRKQQMQRRWNNELPDIEAWKIYFQDVAKSKFLTGKGLSGQAWQANIDWLLKPGNIAKVSEGKYHF